MRFPRRAHAVALAGIVVVAIALAIVWAIRVPFFGEYDELAHLDYALELYAVGKPFHVEDARPVRVYAPALAYLRDATNYRQNRYNPYGDLPAGYGSPPFFARLDANAPPIPSGVPRTGSRLPYVMFYYPAGYYVFAALAMKLAALIRGGSITAMIFAARFVGVFCLPFTILFAYGIFRRLRLRPRTALVATAAAAWLPLMSLVSGYVQPDDLSTTLVTAALYAALCWKDDPHRWRWCVWSTLAVCALALVKEQYAVTALLAVVGSAIARAKTRGDWFRVLGFGVASSIALAAGTRFVVIGHSVAPAFAAHPPPSPLSDRLADVRNILADVYGGGLTFDGFWLTFGIRGAAFFHGLALHVAHSVLVVVTVLSLLAMVARTYNVWRRIGTIARRRSIRSAFGLAIGDPVLSAYAIITSILIALYVVSRGTFWLEGRYWLPVIVPVIALDVVFVSRLFGRRRRTVAISLATAWASYATIAAVAGLFAIERNFYERPAPAATTEGYAEITRIAPRPRCGHDCSLIISGYAVDGERGLPAKDVWIDVDHRTSIRARTRLPSPTVRDAYMDDALASSGIKAELLHPAPGPHVFRIRVVEHRAPRGLPAPATATYVVAP